MITPFTAIFAKETRLLLRSRRAFWLMLLALLTVGLLFGFFWLDAGSSHSTSADRARFGRTLMQMLGLAQLCVMGLVTPITTATAFSGEREHKTLDLLACTAIPRLGLLLGKWFSAIAYQWLLLVCLLPVFSLVFQLGGVGLDEYLVTAAVTAVTVATYAMLGLAISIRSRRSTRAMEATLGLVLILNIGVFASLVLLSEFFHAALPDTFYQSVCSAFSPVFLYAFLVLSPSASTMPLSSPFFSMFLAVHAFIFLVSFLKAWRGLARGETLKPVIAKKIIDDPELLARRRRRFPYYLVDPQRRAHSIGDRQDPVRVKEHRVGGAGRVESTIRLGYAGLLISVGLFLVALNDLVEAQSAVTAITQWALGFTILFAPVFSSTVISREREESTLDLLLTTPLSAWSIVRAKFLAVLRTCLYLSISVALLPSVTMFFVRRDPAGCLSALLKGLPFVLSFLALYVALGLYFSAKSSRNMLAIAAGYAAAALCYLAPFLLLMVLSATHNNSSFSDETILDGGPLAFVFAFLGPIISPVFSLENAFTTQWAQPFQNDARWLLVCCRAVLVGLLALGLLALAARNLARRKEPQ